MSAVNIKRSWVDEMDDNDDDQDDCKAKKMSRKENSRENSNSRRKTRAKTREREGSNGDKKSRSPQKPTMLETDLSVLQRRQKQIDYGKNTVGYHNYVTKVPIDQRGKEDPKTPDKFTQYSRRSWDTLIKMWRIKLHKYDSDNESTNDVNDIEVVVEDDDDDSEGDEE